MLSPSTQVLSPSGSATPKAKENGNGSGDGDDGGDSGRGGDGSGSNSGGLSVLSRTRSYIHKKTSTPSGPSSSSMERRMLSMLPRSTSMFITASHLPRRQDGGRGGSNDGGDEGGREGSEESGSSSSRVGSERGVSGGVAGTAAGAAGMAAGQQQKRPKYKMREETKLLLKLHVIRTKALSLEAKLSELRELTRACQECDEGDERLRTDFLTKVVEIEHEVKLVKKLMLFLCRHKQMERHYL